MKPQFYRKKLQNGMVVLFEKRNLPVVSVAFAVRCGGANETEKDKGISHFVEHLLYKGTHKRNSKQIADEIERNGGVLNGFTDEEITAFWCKMPSRHLRVALDVLGDLVKNPLFDEDAIEKERQVIFEEINLYRDDPRMHALNQIDLLLYKPPFGMPIIGNRETLTRITKKDLVKRFKEIYVPENMILCVVGDADFEDLTAFAEKNFKRRKGEIPPEKIVKKNASQIEKRSGIDQANLIFANHIPLAGDNKSYAAVLLNVLMAGGMSSRLFAEVREKRNLAYAVKGASSISRNFAYNMIYCGVSPQNVDPVKKIIVQEFKKVSEKLNQKELDEVKEQAVGNYQISSEDSQTRMTDLLMSEIDGDAKELYRFERKIKEVKLRDVKNLAKDACKNYSFYALVPDKS